MDKDDVLEQFDPIVQMQLEEFQRHIRQATQATMVVILTEKDGIVQVASGSKQEPEEGKAMATQVMSTVAGAMLAEMTKGQFQLVIKDERSGELFSPGDAALVVVQKNG